MCYNCAKFLKECAIHYSVFHLICAKPRTIKWRAKTQTFHFKCTQADTADVTVKQPSSSRSDIAASCIVSGTARLTLRFFVAGETITSVMFFRRSTTALWPRFSAIDKAVWPSCMENNIALQHIKLPSVLLTVIMWIPYSSNRSPRLLSEHQCQTLRLLLETRLLLEPLGSPMNITRCLVS